ncbi:very long chain fatty acid elongase 7-like [Dermatophagoides pteronyssinus]|uniref:very long chain fatty acid elongase 7-like n=1 Tax=Dermatophagoides pteronyssinus TaxID=6956 RepID=UPI003F66A8BB
MLNNISYYWYDYWKENGHPYTMNNYWICMNGPTRIIMIIIGYLYFCLSLGPSLMMNRKPFELRRIMLCYNIITVVLNLYFFLQSLYYLKFGIRLFDFKFPDHNNITVNDIEQITLIHFYLWTKLFDLFDTIFFVLRKKYNQISGLHLYHHSIVPLLGYCAFCIAPTAPCLGIFPFFNTIIHCIMYSYYALAALGPRLQPYLWWKRYITQLQLAQFVIYGLYLIPFFKYQQGYPIKFWRFIAAPQPIIFFYLFYRFYKQSYTTTTTTTTTRTHQQRHSLNNDTKCNNNLIAQTNENGSLEIRQRINHHNNNDLNNNLNDDGKKENSIK